VRQAPTHCTSCGARSEGPFCVNCGVRLKVGADGEIEEINVSGTDHEHVSEVAGRIASSTRPRHRPTFPKWAPKAGAMFGAVTLLFLMGLTIASTLSAKVPAGAQFLLVSVIALGVAMSMAFLGGDAAAKGQIPIPGVDKHPVEFSVTGGIAAFIIVLIIGNWLSPKAESSIRMSRTLPFETFWVYAGLHNGVTFSEGSYTPVVYRPNDAQRGSILPAIGDVLQVHMDRRVMIANFNSSSNREADILTSPALVDGDIYVHANTGKWVRRGALLLVRDVVPSYDPTKANGINAIWCRVVECVEGIPACEQAELDLRVSRSPQ
jgi:hypothetical protein